MIEYMNSPGRELRRSHDDETEVFVQQALDARLAVAPLPAPYGWAADARSPGDVLDAQALG
ncbi:hypothetical protein AEGHOMDF_3412 [Methylobacterium soli]|nr:hypothetical protein AEGHOMDF_3412 [Methylobacterium soli]